MFDLNTQDVMSKLSLSGPGEKEQPADQYHDAAEPMEKPEPVQEGDANAA
jgi:hypothetical protein